MTGERAEMEEVDINKETCPQVHDKKQVAEASRPYLKSNKSRPLETVLGVQEREGRSTGAIVAVSNSIPLRMYGRSPSDASGRPGMDVT